MDINYKKFNDFCIRNKYLMMGLLILIALYPLRWTFTGADMWDIGYSCGNYVNFSTSSISRPWFFSTYLSLLTGNLLSRLPYGTSLPGIKAYCSLIVSLTVFLSGFFCIRKLKYPPYLVLLGEAWAVSVCYIPGVILYNHLTFLFLILAMIFLYLGLSEDKDILLVSAGIILALNVFVRISNLPQALLIFAVWYYLFLSGLPVSCYFRKTLVCMAGYFVTFLAVFASIGCKYGFDEYVSGIGGMLNISGEAGDYSAGSMVKELVLAYVHGGSRIVYIIIFAFAACLIYRGVSRMVDKRGRAVSFRAIAIPVTALVSVGMIVLFIVRKVLIFDFYHYATVYYSTAFFLVLAMIVCVMKMADKEAEKEEKLVSALILMQMVVMSIGSGTGISPIMNSAFILGPFLFANMQKILEGCFTVSAGESRDMAVYKGIGAAVSGIAIAAFLLQALAFGALYEFEEGGNGAGGTYLVEGNRVLGMTRTTKEKAGLLRGLTDYTNGKNLKGKGVIVYGYAPALAFYLDLTPVITTWPDLDSYGVALMERDIADLKKMIASGDHDLPLIIIDEKGAAEQREHNPAKWEIISGFIDEYGYFPDYDNGRYTVYSSD